MKRDRFAHIVKCDKVKNWRTEEEFLQDAGSLRLLYLYGISDANYPDVIRLLSTPAKSLQCIYLHGALSQTGRTAVAQAVAARSGFTEVSVELVGLTHDLALAWASRAPPRFLLTHARARESCAELRGLEIHTLAPVRPALLLALVEGHAASRLAAGLHAVSLNSNRVADDARVAAALLALPALTGLQLSGRFSAAILSALAAHPRLCDIALDRAKLGAKLARAVKACAPRLLWLDTLLGFTPAAAARFLAAAATPELQTLSLTLCADGEPEEFAALGAAVASLGLASLRLNLLDLSARQVSALCLSLRGASTLRALRLGSADGTDTRGLAETLLRSLPTRLEALRFADFVTWDGRADTTGCPSPAIADEAARRIRGTRLVEALAERGVAVHVSERALTPKPRARPQRAGPP